MLTIFLSFSVDKSADPYSLRKGKPACQGTLAKPVYLESWILGTWNPRSWILGLGSRFWALGSGSWIWDMGLGSRFLNPMDL